MKVNEMKNILVEKFKDENCGFTFKDISIKKVKKDCGITSYDITIKDYEHIFFRMMLDKDDYFGYCVFINENWGDDVKNIIFTDSKYDYNIKSALIQLGYHIANTF